MILPKSDTTILEIIDLYSQEVQLLKALRTRFRFGEVTIIMRDGIPVQLKRVTEFENLT